MKPQDPLSGLFDPTAVYQAIRLMPALELNDGEHTYRVRCGDVERAVSENDMAAAV